MQNPITRTRTAMHMTQLQLSKNVGCHEQAIFLNEQGVYSAILPKIGNWLIAHGENGQRIAYEYRRFQEDRRKGFGERNTLNLWTLDSLGPPVGSPFERFRDILGFSRMRLCKSLCIHPGKELAVESGSAESMGGQIREALLQAGLDAKVIAELDSRIREFHNKVK
jgi:hypothetical protein